MKLSKIFVLFLTTICLTSCNPKPFKKVIFNYTANPQLLKISGKELYNLAITSTKSLAVFYSVEGCAGCNALKEQMKAYAKKESCNIYYVDMTTIQKEDYNYVVDASVYANSYHEFPAYGQTLTLPFMDIYAYQGIVWRFNDQFIDYLLKYAETAKPNSSK